MMRDLCIWLEDGICVQLIESSNPLFTPECVDCIGIYAYNPDGAEACADGELEYQ